jgi:hypothetical protein
VLAAEGGLELASGAIQISELVAPSGQSNFSNVTNGGVAQGSQVIWNLPGLMTGDQLDVGYELNIFPVAGSAIQIDSSMKWIDCNGYPQESALARVDNPVQIPTASGSGTAPILTPTATLQPDNEDRGGVIFWLPICLPLLFLPLVIYLLYRRFSKRQKSENVVNKPTWVSPQPIPKPPESDPDEGTDLHHDIISRNAVDKQGKNLKLRVSWSPNRRDVGGEFAAGRSAQIKVWLDETDKDIFRVSANLILEKKQDDLTGTVEQRKIGALQIRGQDPDGRRGLLALTFQEIKTQAKFLGVQELRAENVPTDCQPQLQELGFKRKTDAQFTIKI